MSVFIFGLFVHVFLQAKSEVCVVDSTKALNRPRSGHGLAYATFAAHKFRHLNITTLVSASVKDTRECGKLCIDHSSCFSANYATFFHEEGKILCELLPSDKYNNSNKFLNSTVFHHLSIKVSKTANNCCLIPTFSTYMGSGGGGGGHSKKFYTGKLAPRGQNPYPFYTIFDRKGPPFVYLP